MTRLKKTIAPVSKFFFFFLNHSIEEIISSSMKYKLQTRDTTSESSRAIKHNNSTNTINKLGRNKERKEKLAYLMKEHSHAEREIRTPYEIQ